ncbi:OPT oligopeptide transporter protein-domain-containing protein [Lipomyces arxii]|uniref:OPT oligopeptide transporter protein-domain-containing protein n=1 Tax=Lipomyces arxii TaxID=56418 RepID=UPI0034CD7A3F
MHRYAVYSIKAMWPQILPNLQVNKTLMISKTKQSINDWTIPTYRMFAYAFGIMFVLFWLPNYLFTALSTFNWMTWNAPKNVNLAYPAGSRPKLVSTRGILLTDRSSTTLHLWFLSFCCREQFRGCSSWWCTRAGNLLL